jgi:hypothetical protein
MNLLILAVFLTIMQAEPPVPRKTPDNSTPASESVQKHTSSNNASATPTPTVQEKAVAPETQDESGHASTANADHAVIIREPVPMSVIKDWADYLSIFSSFCLFLIGGFGVCYAVKTLKEIKRQADLMEKQISIPYRARLSAGEPRLKDMEAQFPIENYGHVEARLLSVGIEIIIHSTVLGKEIHRRDMQKKPEQIIVPGKNNALTLCIKLAHAPQKGEDHVFSITVEYDTGFKSSDKLEFIRVYKGDIAKWVKGWGIMEIDFLEPKAKA